MSTRNAIIDAADQFIREKGYNAFSFRDISEELGIKSASIHYHFPTKSDLGVATILEHEARLSELKKKVEGKSPIKKLEAFLSIYDKVKSEGKICLVGSLATDFNTVDKNVRIELKSFAGMILDWVTEILKEGRQEKVFEFAGPPRSKAVMVITNMLAIVQLSRLTGVEDFEMVRANVLKELKPKKQ